MRQLFNIRILSSLEISVAAGLLALLAVLLHSSPARAQVKTDLQRELYVERYVAAMRENPRAIASQMLFINAVVGGSPFRDHYANYFNSAGWQANLDEIQTFLPEFSVGIGLDFPPSSIEANYNLSGILRPLLNFSYMSSEEIEAETQLLANFPTTALRSMGELAFNAFENTGPLSQYHPLHTIAFAAQGSDAIEPNSTPAEYAAKDPTGTLQRMAAVHFDRLDQNQRQRAFEDWSTFERELRNSFSRFSNAPRAGANLTDTEEFVADELSEISEFLVENALNSAEYSQLLGENSARFLSEMTLRLRTRSTSFSVDPSAASYSELRSEYTYASLAASSLANIVNRVGSGHDIRTVSQMAAGLDAAYNLGLASLSPNPTAAGAHSLKSISSLMAFAGVGASSGPTAEQAILEQLQHIMEALQAVSSQLNALSSQISRLERAIDEGFSEVKADLSQLDGKLQEIMFSQEFLGFKISGDASLELIQSATEGARNLRSVASELRGEPQGLMAAIRESSRVSFGSLESYVVDFAVADRMDLAAVAEASDSSFDYLEVDNVRRGVQDFVTAKIEFAETNQARESVDYFGIEQTDPTFDYCIAAATAASALRPDAELELERSHARMLRGVETYVDSIVRFHPDLDLPAQPNDVCSAIVDELDVTRTTFEGTSILWFTLAWDIEILKDRLEAHLVASISAARAQKGHPVWDSDCLAFALRTGTLSDWASIFPRDDFSRSAFQEKSNRTEIFKEEIDRGGILTRRGVFPSRCRVFERMTLQQLLEYLAFTVGLHTDQYTYGATIRGQRCTAHWSNPDR